METKGISLTSAIESALASVYKRSFINNIHNRKRHADMTLFGTARVSTEDQPPCPGICRPPGHRVLFGPFAFRRFLIAVAFRITGKAAPYVQKT